MRDMTQFIKVVHTLHYFAEALSWGAIAYSAFLIFGRGWLGILCGGLALIATISVWSLFASSRAFFRSPIAVVASRAVLYALAIVGLVVAELPVEAIILAVLLVLTEGILIGFKAHPALHPHSGGQARLVSDANPKTAERRTPSNRGPALCLGCRRLRVNNEPGSSCPGVKPGWLARLRRRAVGLMLVGSRNQRHRLVR